LFVSKLAAVFRLHLRTYFASHAGVRSLTVRYRVCQASDRQLVKGGAFLGVFGNASSFDPAESMNTAMQ
jgi:hypothetical protein